MLRQNAACCANGTPDGMERPGLPGGMMTPTAPGDGRYRRIAFPASSPYSGVARPKPPETLRICPVV